MTKNNNPADRVDNVALNDKRFAIAATRPQFRPKSGKDEGVAKDMEGDERFQAMYTDSRFQVPGDDKDKYGRKIRKQKSNSKTKKQPNTGGMNPSMEKEEVDHSATAKAKKDSATATYNAAEARIAYLTALSRGEIDNSSSSSSDALSDDESFSSDSTGSQEEEEWDVDLALHSQEDHENNNDLITYESSPYLAVCNLDWRHVRAVDIFVILSSFCSNEVKSVKIYKSNFGKERLEKERIYGPPAAIWKKTKEGANDQLSSQEETDDTEPSSDSSLAGEEEASVTSTENSTVEDDNEEIEREGEDEKDDPIANHSNDLYKHFPHQSMVVDDKDKEYEDIDTEKLRAYERSKLKYYFAVAEFHNADAADRVYKELDGMEFENSSASFDLRSIGLDQLSSIPVGEEEDVCHVVPSNYQPPKFVVEALQHTRVECTWDEATDKERERKLTQFFGVSADAWNAMVEGDDLKAYLASSSDSSASDDDEEEGEQRNEGTSKRQQKAIQLRKLLGLENDEDTEMSKHADEEQNLLSTDSERNSDEEEEGKGKEAIIKLGVPDLSSKIRSKLEDKHKDEKKLTPWEKYQEKRKEKKLQKRQQKRRDKNFEDIDDGDGMYGEDPEFGVPEWEGDDKQEDDFFIEQAEQEDKSHDQEEKKGKNERPNSKKEEKSKNVHQQLTKDGRVASTKEELELLLASDEGELYIFYF